MIEKSPIKNSRESSSSSGDQNSPKKRDPRKNLEANTTISVRIETLNQSISSKKRKETCDLTLLQNLRWVEDTKRNRELLLSFIIKKVIINKAFLGLGGYYLPCCNHFSLKKPTGQGHHDILENPIKFLMEEEEEEKLKEFISILRAKNRRLEKEKEKSGTTKELISEIMLFIKENLHLKKVKRLIEGLPRKGQYFHLPLVSTYYSQDCPGSCPLGESDEPLKYKVNLITCDPDLGNKKDEPASKKQKSTKKNKKVKKKKRLEGSPRKQIKTEKNSMSPQKEKRERLCGLTLADLFQNEPDYQNQRFFNRSQEPEKNTTAKNVTSKTLTRKLNARNLATQSKTLFTKNGAPKVNGERESSLSHLSSNSNTKSPLKIEKLERNSPIDTIDFASESRTDGAQQQPESSPKDTIIEEEKIPIEVHDSSEAQTPIAGEEVKDLSSLQEKKERLAKLAQIRDMLKQKLMIVDKAYTDLLKEITIESEKGD